MSRSIGFSLGALFLVVGCQASPSPIANTYAVVSCSSSGDCGPGSSCTDDHCLTACTTDSACPAGAVCIGGACYSGRFDACATDSDCRGGELCVAGHCAELPPYRGCTTDSECPTGSACDATTGRCDTSRGSLSLWCSDMGVTMLFFSVGAVFWRWLERTSSKRLIAPNEVWSNGASFCVRLP